MASTLSLLRGRVGLIVAIAALIAASLSVTMLASAGASTHRSGSHRVVHHRSSIPQGRNAGDGDSDNHGGPNDGDGNV